MKSFKEKFISTYNLEKWEELLFLVKKLENHESINYKFKNPEKYCFPVLMIRGSSMSSNQFERLEYFGDIVLKMVINQYLFTKFPEFNEGKLTEYSAIISSNQNFAGHFDKLGIAKLSSLLDTGDFSTKQKADFIEALIAGIFFDSNNDYVKVKEICLKLFNYDDTVNKFELKPWGSKNTKGYLNELIINKTSGKGKLYYKTRKIGPQNALNFICTLEYSSQGQVSQIDLKVEGEVKSKKKDAELSAAEKMIYEVEEYGKKTQ